MRGAGVEFLTADETKGPGARLRRPDPSQNQPRSEVSKVAEPGRADRDHLAGSNNWVRFVIS